MKKAFLFLTLLIVLFAKDISAQKLKPVETPGAILKNFKAFLTYYGNNINLEAYFKGFDGAMHPISKDAFLKEMMSGEYLPLRLQSKGVPLYQLYKLGAAGSKQVKETLSGWAIDYYSRYSKIGKKLPHFRFVDMNGKVYSSENTKGKIVLLESWDISCSYCIQSIPQLNKLVAQYKNWKDIVFISVVPDPKNKAKAFLAKRPFNYPIAPGQHYFPKTVNIQTAPTHLVVNKRGYIDTVVNMPDALAAALKKEISLN